MTIPNEPPQISGGENPDALEHWAIYRAFNPQNTSDAYTAAGNYQRLAATWETTVTEFATRIRRSSAAAWEGPAAEASRQAIDTYAQRALDLAPALSALSQTVTTAVTGVDNTKANVTEPHNSVGWHFWNPDGWGNGPRSRKSIDAARDHAREAMRNYYLTDFKTADSRIPVLPQPVSPTNPLYTAEIAGRNGGTDDGGGKPSSGPNPGDSGGHSGDGPVPGLDEVDPGRDAPNPSGDHATPTDPASVQPGGTGIDPASATGSDHGASTRPAGIGSGAPGSGGGGVPGTGGFPGGGGGSGGGSSVNAPGRSVPGAPGVGTPAAAAAAARAGNPGTPGMGLPGMPGGRGKSEDDENTHDTPDWLKNMDNTEELLGKPPRTIPGGVIGGDHDQPEPPQR
ncbi:WXG100 family type VII secretion target [Nocardia sp. NPDC004068]|uniref:WXG100 family type VII secretion target n=1 Tax=Nocardia sp. NPDC004068 TaxID=3364303 RepID=UPI00368C485B